MTDVQAGRGSAPSDPGQEPINPHEEFRRAKRNSLWWSSLTVLTCVALPNSANSDVAFNLANVTLPAWLLLLSLVATSTFMFVGYIRADRTLRHTHSASLFEKRAGDAVEAVDRLKADAEAAITQIGEAKERSQGIREYIDAMIVNAKSRLDSNEQEVRGITALLYEPTHSFERLKKNGAPADQLVRAAEEAMHQIRQEAQSVVDRIRERAVGSIQAMKEFPDDPPFSLYDPPLKEIKASIDRVGQTSSELRRFHTAINKSDIAWYRGHDVAPVWALFIGAALLCIYKVVAFALDPSSPWELLSGA